MEEQAELVIPSVLGSEKIALEKAASLAKLMGFREGRIEDLKTAVSEACINAIEHGNQLDRNKMVGISFFIAGTALKVVIRDNGKGIDPRKIPTQRTDADGFPLRRGHGIFLIKNLVNEFSYEAKPGDGNAVTMIMKLEMDEVRRSVFAKGAVATEHYCRRAS